jgi:Domain of unknown function (DUF4157)
MSNDDQQNGGGRDGFGRRTAEQTEQQGPRRPDPGKVTLASKLSPSRAPAVQRRAAVAQKQLVQRKASTAYASTPGRKSAWELTMDSAMDAAHRGATALPDESHAAVQARGDLHANDPASVHRAAAAGVSGAGSALPYFDRIQEAFGGAHDLNHVRAHVGGEAAAAGAHIRADAYATGNHVAFRGPPDLHTAAVVRGESAGPILDQLAGTPEARHGAGASSVQLKGKGAAKKQREARDYEASWDDISAAAHGDEASIAKLDVAWIDSLDPYVVQEIDREFHKPKLDQEFEKKHAASKYVKAIKSWYEAEKKQLSKEARARLAAAGVKDRSPGAISEDPVYVADLDARTVERDEKLETARTEQRAAFDAHKVKPKAPMMVITPPEDGVMRVEGRMLARADFMSWGILVLGSADRVKEHFRAIQPVPGTRGMYFHKAAADRYVAARKWFEDTYPGYTFLNTTVAMQLRNRHQEGHPLGKLGHPLGLSADFAAYDNPNQLGDGASQYMLRRFGGTGERTPGANQLETDGNSFHMTKEIGQATARGDELTSRQLAFLDSVERGFNEMAATSRRFQASRQEQMPHLRQAESLWFEAGVPALARLRAAERQVEPATKGAVRSLGKQLEGQDADARQAMIAREPKVQAAITARDAAQERFDAIKHQVTAVMQAVFEPWTSPLQAQVDAALANHDSAHIDLHVTVDNVDKLLGSAKGARKRKDIEVLVARNKEAFSALDVSALPEDFQTAKEGVVAYLESVREAKWSSGEVRVKLELIRRLTESPEAVFGTQSVRDEQSGRLQHKPTVMAPTVMQYLERGFVRDSEMPGKPDAKSGGKDAKGVFNGKFIKCMAMFGFNTLATWSGVDTMHFDFREGFDGIQQHDLYGP